MKYGIYYHGTCADHLDSILKNGFGGDYYPHRLWSDSFCQHTYYWSPTWLAKLEGNVDIETAQRYAFDRAAFSAVSALCRAKDCRIMILKVRVPKDWMLEDTSGPNMEGAVCTPECIPVSMIQTIKVSQDLSALRTAFISDQICNSINALVPTEVEKLTLKLVNNDYNLPELLDSIITWEKIELFNASKLKIA